ncbi:MAG: reverse transcriptase N-terminal domain-containing protein, partial [Pseudomonadales bacterium]|nr:reverse transcriptase N-terminal domain-containing protein [Pseudomonadales bacterium]
MKIYQQDKPNNLMKKWATLNSKPITPASLWNSTDWKKVEKRVNKLQTRITKATLRGNGNLVKKLQYLLTSSFYSKLLSVKRVTSNKGKRTAGIDNQLWKSPTAKYKAALSLKTKGYKAKPLRRVYIEKKGKKKKRPLGIPTMYDRGIQALYALALDPVAEATADKTSFGFR